MRTRATLLSLSLAATVLAPMISRADTLATDVAGIPADQVGVHGPKTDYGSNLELVGKTPVPVQGTDAEGQPAVLPIGNNGGIALIGDCAFVGRWHDYTSNWGLQIVDVSDPANPHRVGALTKGLPKGGVAREIRAVDLPGVRLLVVLTFGVTDSGVSSPGSNGLYVYSIGEDCADQDTTSLVGKYEMYTIRGHEFFLWVDPNSDPESPRIIAYVTTPIVPPNILVIDVSNTPRLLTAYEAGIPLVSPREVAGQGLGSYAHSISVSSDGREAYVSYWDGGFFTLDTSQIAAAMPFPVITPKGAMSVPYVYPADRLGNTHSATVVPGTRTAVVGDEIYAATDGCPFGWMHTISLGDEQTPPSLQGEFRLDENDPAKCISHSTVPTGTPPSASSRNELGKPVDGTFTMHNQTTIPELVLTTWYGGGLRVVRVDDPADPKEEGFFVPVPVAATATSPYSGAFQTYGTVTPGDPDDDWQIQTWSYPVIRDGLIYFTDVRNGLYIVRPTLDAPFAAEVAATSYAEGNSNLSALL